MGFGEYLASTQGRQLIRQAIELSRLGEEAAFAQVGVYALFYENGVMGLSTDMQLLSEPGLSGLARRGRAFFARRSSIVKKAVCGCDQIRTLADSPIADVLVAAMIERIAEALGLDSSLSGLAASLAVAVMVTGLSSVCAEYWHEPS